MRLPNIIVPASVLVAAGTAYPLKEAFNVPSTQVTNAASSSTASKTVEMIVEGVKCRGTANFFSSRIRGLPGILDITTYAADHRVVISFDPAKTDTNAIRAASEAPVRGRDGQMNSFFRVTSLEER